MHSLLYPCLRYFFALAAVLYKIRIKQLLLFARAEKY